MPNWIETEDKEKLVNADHVTHILIAPMNKPGLHLIRAEYTGDCDNLLVGLTLNQALEAMKHLALWLPSATPRTIYMSDLAKSVKKSKTEETQTKETQTEKTETRQLDHNGEAR